MRRLSREIALQALFHREFTAQMDFHEFVKLLDQSADRETLQYAQNIVNGVAEQRDELDSMIQAASRHWKIERMSVVDRCILRMACFEMHGLNLKPEIAIHEAVDIAKKFGSTDSGAFVNGILDQVCREMGK